MPFLEEYIKSQREPKPQAVETFVYTTKIRGDGPKHELHHLRAGCVFIGSKDECSKYVAQQRAKQAIRAAERGMNPSFTR